MRKIIKPTAAIAPMPVALVSCGDLEKSNITTVAWTGMLSSDPLLLYISLRPTRYSYNIIKEKKEFCINLPTKRQVVESDLCGTKSGRDIDKFKECKFTKELCTNISAPYIKECPINLECKVKEIKNLGTHDMIIAEIISVNVEENLLDENENILFEKANLFSFAGKKYLKANQELDDRGICLK